MPTLYLHIGAGKTGTSALQAAFAKNRPRLAELGIFYPDTPANIGEEDGVIGSGNGTLLAKYLVPCLMTVLAKLIPEPPRRAVALADRPPPAANSPAKGAA